jgi:hypothetical protein
MSEVNRSIQNKSIEVSKDLEKNNHTKKKKRNNKIHSNTASSSSSSDKTHLGFWRSNFERNNNKSVSCAVCLEEFEQNQEVLSLECADSHIFHPVCLNNWAQQNHSCPICRTDFVEAAKNLISEFNEMICV